VIWLTVDTFKLANTEDEARAGTVVDLLSTGTGATHLLVTSNIFPNSAAYYDFFRKVRLLGTGLPAEGETIEADSVRDTLSIIAGSNIYFTDVNKSTDTFVINAPDYNFEVPLGTTDLRLYSDQGDDQAVTITPVRGIAITRIGPQELGFESFGVTETDTLHTVASRGNITSQQLILKDLLVGFLESIPGIDGFVSMSVSAGDAITGLGTLDSPLILSPDESQRTDAAHTVTVNFSTPSQGTMNYTAVYKTTAVLSSGSVVLQRKNPSTLIWETLDSVSGATERTSYQIENIYSEPEVNPVEFRIIFDWTGNFEYVNYRIRLTFELEPIATKQMIFTDTEADTMVLGTDTSSTLFRSLVTHDGPNIFRDYIDTEGLRIFKNNIEGTNSNDNIIIDPHGTGKVELRTNDLITDQTTFNIIDELTTTVNAFGTATIINMGADSGTLTIGNPTVVGTQTTQNIYDTVATTVNAFGDASTLNIGDNTGTLTLRNPTVVGTETTQNLYNTVATTVNAFGIATIIDIGADSGTITIGNPTLVGTQTTQNVYDTVATTVNAFGAATAIDMGSTTGTITINNPTLVGTQPTQNVYDTVATTVNAFGAATAIDLGATTGTLTINNPTVVGTQTTQNLYNTAATTMNFAGAATAINIGAAGSSGTVTIRNDNVVLDGDLEIKGGDLTTNQTTFNLLNTVATTVNAFGAADTVNLSNLVITSTNTIDSDDSSGITFIPLVAFNSDVVVENDLTVNRAMIIGTNLTVAGDLTVNGTTVTLNTTTLDVEDLNITVAKGAASAAAANGAGLTVDGASATLTYASADNSWNFNKILKATGVEGTPIGSTTRAAGNFTTLNANGNVTLGDADTDTITVASSFVTGTVLRSAKADTNTLALAAYDVNDTTYTNLITLTASNTPTLTLTSTGVGTINNMSIGATTASSGRFTTLKIKDTSAAFDLSIIPLSSTALTSDRSLTINVVDNDRVLRLAANADISGALTISSDFTVQSGAVILTGQLAGSSVTLPSSGTLATTGNLSQFAATTSLQLAGVISDETGSGALVFGTSPTIATPDITFKNAAVTGDADYAFDASTTQVSSWIANFTATRTLIVSNLTAGRMARVYVRNTNGTARLINVTASTTGAGHAAVNLAGNFVGANAAGQISATGVTLVATTGTAVITVWNAGGSLVGMVN
jgi:hypothetical protein